MKAAWYEGFGPASEVLVVGEMNDPVPGPGEVLVRLRASGVNPSDVKLRGGARPGAIMAHPRVIPHSDGAGDIVAAGPGAEHRVGERVWIWNGQWQRAFGTAAELIALPEAQAVTLPDAVSYAEGACLGIPATTACHALFSDGEIEGKTVLIHGGAGSVGRYACQMAALAGARVITTVSSADKAAHSGAEHCIDYKTEDTVARVMELTEGQGVDRIVDVDFARNQAVNLAVLRPSGVIAAYASASAPSPTLDFYGFMFRNITLHMLIVYILPEEARGKCEARLTRWLQDGALSHAVVPGGSLDHVAAAHGRVERGEKLGTVVLSI